MNPGWRPLGAALPGANGFLPLPGRQRAAPWRGEMEVVAVGDRSGGGLRLRRIFFRSMPFVLQQSPGLVETNWTDVTNTPVLNTTNITYEVVLPCGSDPTFFRLASTAE